MGHWHLGQRLIDGADSTTWHTCRLDIQSKNRTVLPLAVIFCSRKVIRFAFGTLSCCVFGFSKRLHMLVTLGISANQWICRSALIYDSIKARKQVGVVALQLFQQVQQGLLLRNFRVQCSGVRRQPEQPIKRPTVCLQSN